MGKPKGLVIVHVDGLGYQYLKKALEQGRMPFLQNLIENEGYEALRYRCGLPSTTPYCQAGILYGDNSEIPSFRWWDKQAGLAVTFSGFSSFKHVAHKYFRGCDALTSGGAAIATCYPSSAKATYRLSYREHGHSLEGQDLAQRRVVLNWAMNPLHLVDWLRRGLYQIWKINSQYWKARFQGRPTARMYVVSELLEEILLHQLTRFAAVQAMQQNLPVIYVAFYAYDETGHAFGPAADYSFRILRHVDNSIRRIARQRYRAQPDARDYELVILSDHGQVETVPFDKEYGRRLGEIIAEWLPAYEVEEFRGKRITPREAIDGHVALMYSGGLAHLYFRDISWRLSHAEIEERFPDLITNLAGAPGIAFVLTREDSDNIITTNSERIRYNAREPLPRPARELLRNFDEPEVTARQLAKLNSFERSGDLVFIGKYLDGHQINFETQVGGHGSLGGEQQFPFILAKREWQFDTSGVVDATGIYALLRRLRDQMVK